MKDAELPLVREATRNVL